MVPAGTSAMSPVIARSVARSVALNTQNSHKANKHRPVSVSFRFDLVTFSKASNVYRNVKNLMYHEIYYFATNSFVCNENLLIIRRAPFVPKWSEKLSTLNCLLFTKSSQRCTKSSQSFSKVGPQIR